jgi:hypothetical protein
MLDFRLRSAGQVVEVGSCGGGPAGRLGGGPRGLITAWSEASRRRLLKLGFSIDWAAVLAEAGGSFLMVTLTYLNDPGPDAAKGHLHAMRKRFERHLGAVRALWKMEFQRRGVVHLHLLLWAPFDDPVGLASFRRWLWVAWEGVTGERLRVDADFLRKPPGRAGAYFAGYATKGSKDYQHQVPESWQRTGRWWGRWGVEPMWEERSLTEGEFFRTRRVLLAHLRSKARTGRWRRRRVRRRTIHQGCWSTGTRAGTLSRAVLRVLEPP